MKIILIFGAVGALSGCVNDPKEANNENFTIALNQYLYDRNVCFTHNGSLPYRAKRGDKTETTELLDILVKQGFLFIEDKEAEVMVGRSMLGSGEKQVMPVREYTLTEAGKNVSEKKLINTMFTVAESFRFCYGHYEVKEILGFSEPADFHGEHMSKVDFTYAVASIADWAYQVIDGKEDGLNTLNRHLERVKDKANLVLMPDGWVYRKELQ